MAVDLQRKYRYTVQITINSLDGVGTTHTAVVDEFTPSDVRREPVTRQNHSLGQLTLVGPATYTEMTLRLALRIGESTVSDLIEALQELEDNDVDTCNVTLSTQVTSAGVEEVAYRQTFTNCRLTGFKLDAFNRKDDGDFVHAEITLIPEKTGNIIKEI